MVGGTEIRTDLVVIGAGVRPATDLLIRAGAEHLPDQSVRVDASMRTSLPDVFAAGDCAALHHLVLDGQAWVPLGPAANKTGRVAGTVAGGGAASFGGIVGTAVVKVFGLEVARTGLTLAEAQAAGLAAAAVDVVSRSRAKYYPGAQPLHVRLVHAPDGAAARRPAGRPGGRGQTDRRAGHRLARRDGRGRYRRARPQLRPAVRAGVRPGADRRDQSGRAGQARPEPCRRCP